MKRFALLVVCLVAVATPTLAKNGVGSVGAYGDNAGMSCDIPSPGGSALVHVYVVHKFQNGEESTYSRFKGVWPAGMSWLNSFTTAPFPAIGTFNTDVSVAYGGCQTTTILVGDALFLSISPDPACSLFEILTADGQTTPLATDCAFTEVEVGVSNGFVNGDEQTCPCATATAPTSWGKVKALYR